MWLITIFWKNIFRNKVKILHNLKNVITDIKRYHWQNIPHSKHLRASFQKLMENQMRLNNDVLLLMFLKEVKFMYLFMQLKKKKN